MLISLPATTTITVLFQPLRERLQRAVNHLMYGERHDPYAVIARLGQRLEATFAPEAVLPAIVETIATTLKFLYAAISLRNETNSDSMVTVYGHAANALERFPLVYQHELIGVLIVASRVGDSRLSNADRNLLETLADQAATAAYAVRLTSALQHSREKLVTAREEERRRIRRDLHDGLGPALASMTLQLDAALNSLYSEPQWSAELLLDLKTQTRDALADIRRLVYALRPPALDELGLMGALREQISHYDLSEGLAITLNVPTPLPPLSAAVEVAIYRIVTEALTNIVKHARATRCSVKIDPAEHQIEIQIQDDGVGIAEGASAGIGLNSMRERAVELGGTFVIESRQAHGTQIVARLPLSQDAI